MSFIKISSLTIAKSFLLVFLLSSGFFLSGAKAEASSVTWKGSASYPGYWSYTETGDYYNPPATYVLGTFFASTNKDVYTVGETAFVTVAAAAGDGGNAFNVWWDPATNAVLNFFFGNSVPSVDIVATFGSYLVAECHGNGSCSSTQSIAVSVPPGNYNLSLFACRGSAGCAPSSLSFSVVCPGGTSWDGSNCVVPALVPVNAVCGTTHYSCTAGRHVATGGVNQVESASGYTWHCGGSNGGSDATNCSETKAPCTFSGSVSWPPGCGATVSGTLPSGAGTTVTNTNAGYSGSKNYSCSNGTWIAGSESCAPVAGPVAPTINSFTGTYGAQINQTTLDLLTGGGNVTLKWSTTNATSCFAYNDWTGWKVVNNISIGESVSATLSKKYTYTLECWNSTGVSTGRRSVVVNVAGASVFVCTGPIPPNTSVYSGDRTDLGADTNYSYSAKNTDPPKCQYSCAGGYTWNGSGCVPPTTSCTTNCNRDNQVCSGQPYNDANNCAPNNCTGTRLCDYNWKEVAP